MTLETSLWWDHTSQHVHFLTRDQSEIIATLLHQNSGRATPFFKVGLHFELNTPVKSCHSIVHVMMLSSWQNRSDGRFNTSRTLKLTSVILLILQISNDCQATRHGNTSGQLRNKKRTSIAGIKYKIEIQRQTTISKGNGTKQEWHEAQKPEKGDETGRDGNRKGREAEQTSWQRKAGSAQTLYTRADSPVGHRWPQETGRKRWSKTGQMRAELRHKTGNNQTTNSSYDQKMLFLLRREKKDKQNTTDRKSNSQNVWYFWNHLRLSFFL